MPRLRHARLGEWERGSCLWTGDPTGHGRRRREIAGHRTACGLRWSRVVESPSPRATGDKGGDAGEQITLQHCEKTYKPQRGPFANSIHCHNDAPTRPLPFVSPPVVELTPVLGFLALPALAQSSAPSVSSASSAHDDHDHDHADSAVPATPSPTGQGECMWHGNHWDCAGGSSTAAAPSASPTGRGACTWHVSHWDCEEGADSHDHA